AEQPPPVAPPVAAPVPKPAVAPSAPKPAVAAPAPKPAVAARQPLATEKALTEQWLVWLGGLALALGGAFLVKLSIDQGLLGPTVRVALGAVTGIGLMALGHWLKLRAGNGRDLPWQVPPALVGAGGSMLFVSIYAAHALYHLVGRVPTFATLALVVAVIALMSLAHGAFVALLGLVGAYALPALVRADVPNAVGLFAYLLVVSGGLLALLRWRSWWWMAWAVLVASAGWTLVWLVVAWQPGDEAVLGGYLCALFALFAAFRLGVPRVPFLTGMAEAPMARRVVTVAALVVAGSMLAVMLMAQHSPVALALPLVLGLGFMAFGWRDAVFDRLPWLGAVLLVVVLGTWAYPLPQHFGLTAALGVALFGGAGLLAAFRAPRPWTWAALSAGAPVALLAVSYWRLMPLAPDWGWSIAALFLAAVLVTVAEQFNRRRAQPGIEGALGAAATGVIAALALAATFALAEAWLTVALAVLVVGIAWIDGKLHVTGLRKVALLVAAAVLVRLVGNPWLLDYALVEGGTVDWLVYGYGLPAIAFWTASRLFRRGADDLLVAVLEAGTVAFAMLLVSLEIHYRLTGGLDVDLYMTTPMSLLERSLHIISWSAGAAVLFAAQRRSGSPVLLWAGRLLLGLATAQAVLVQALSNNPLYTGEPVGEGAVFNLLLLAYAAPALLYVVHAFVAPQPPVWLRKACGGLALAFAFLWVSLEVRHAFAGSVLDAYTTPVEQAEMWVYSVVWLLGGVAMLGGGIWGRSALLRRAGLGVVLVVVAKVFILDLSQLSGLWRALSFLGLGAVLVGIGGLYRRFAKYI
ncbi:MAG TPA: DUF2339 domain-containing protein, partial [Magnetospirillum sp.]|nr:DUF2339 domain-containing protein [Magnetospirillum sp.]